MPNTPPRCRHLHTDGRQCGSPAVRHEKLCYQHLAARQRPSYTPTLPDPEDLHAVARGLAELLRLTARELLEDRQAKRLLAILTAAGANLARLHRQQAQTRELDLRERALALAEARLSQHHAEHQAQHPTQKPVILSEGEARVEGPAVPSPTETGCPTFGAVSPRLRWASTDPELPVTDPVDDPDLGPLAPGPDPEPRPETVSNPTHRLSFRSDAEESASRTTAAQARKPQPEQPSRARQAERDAELDAEALEQIEFMREENRRSAERQQLHEAAYRLRYERLSPEKKREEDERYAAEIAHFFGYTLEEIAQLPPTPVLASQPSPQSGDHPATPLEC